MTRAVVSIYVGHELHDAFDVYNVRPSDVGMSLGKFMPEIHALKQCGRVMVTHTEGNLTKIVMVSR